MYILATSGFMYKPHCLQHNVNLCTSTLLPVSCITRTLAAQCSPDLDVLHYTAQRVCQRRSPDPKEQDDMKSMERNAEILEFFEDFYAGFLQILLQLYIWFGTLDWVESHKLEAAPSKMFTWLRSFLI